MGTFYGLKKKIPRRITRAIFAAEPSLAGTEKYMAGNVEEYGDQMVIYLSLYFPDTISESAAQVKHVRVHEAGDFYSQKYLKKWFKIAETLPHVKFLAYTKSFQLNFSACPDNFTLYLSRDSSSTPRMLKLADKHVKKYGFKIARMVMPGETPPKGYQTCTPYGLKEHYCAHVCHKCWIGKKNIYFDKH